MNYTSIIQYMKLHFGLLMKFGASTPVFKIVDKTDFNFYGQCSIWYAASSIFHSHAMYIQVYGGIITYC